MADDTRDAARLTLTVGPDGVTYRTRTRARRGPARATLGPVQLRVVDGYTVYDGAKQHHGGAIVEAAPDVAALWVRRGWAQTVEAPPRARRQQAEQ